MFRLDPIPDNLDQVKGRTLVVYIFLLRQNKPLSAREIQRKTNISSPSLALYHLNKLEKLGLVERDVQEGFFAAKVVKTGILTFFVIIGRLLIPRHVFYAVFTTSFLIVSLLLFDWMLTPTFLLLMVLLVFSVCVFWFETVSLWKYIHNGS
jgi:hypothetical protein